MIKNPRKFLALAAVLTVLGSVPFIATACAKDAPADEQIVYLPREEITVETRAGQDYVFDVEMATKSDEQSRGLMYRTQLNNDSGMLFVFNDPEKRSFWMKNTFIPLDILFINEDGVINHIHHGAKPQDETHITTDRPAIAVLEINAGLAGTLNIKEGDRILHPAFKNVVVAPE